MAGRGMAPKPTRSRARDTKTRDSEMTRIEEDGELRGPDLADGILPDGEEWNEQTRAWWDTWRRSPQAQTFTQTDWRFLVDTALLHHIFWTKGRWEYASELRLRAAKFGATPEDRMRLKLKVEAPGGSPAAAASGPTEIHARRKSLRIVNEDNAG
ncbi:hypothetical protein ACFRFJ_17135 [Streptomyces hydrogenans]|uniref:phage terminase small subunit n=1 Tax=Streptomyces hydrogenans TaxID=1873719 RepID=UPI003686E7E5